MASIVVLLFGAVLGFWSGVGAAPKAPRSETRVLLFLSMGCACSNDQLLELATLSRRYGGRGFEFAIHGVNEEAPLSEREGYERALGTPVRWEGSRALAESFKVDRTPLAIVLGPDGRELYRGGIRSTDERPLLEAAFEDLVAGREIRQPVGKSIGCALRLTYRPAKDRF